MLRRCVLVGFMAASIQPAIAGRRAKKNVPTVPLIPAALSLPTDRAPVYANLDEVPALLGSNFDLTSLSRTELTWTIGSDVSFLDDLDEAVVLKQLAADPRWRVGREEGGVVAVSRQPVAGKLTTWSMPWHGYVVGESDCARTGLTFTDRTRTWAWSDSELVATTASTDAEHRMSGVRLLGRACRDQMGSALVIQGPIALEIFESSHDDSRKHTVSVFEDVQQLREVALRGKQIARDGYSAALLPEAGVRIGHPSLELEPSPSGIALEAWQNVGAAGWSWLRVLDADLHPWEEAAIATATLERVGWSPDVQERFLMQAEIPLPEGNGFAGTAEIWVVLDGEDMPTRVDTAPIKIPSR